MTSLAPAKRLQLSHQEDRQQGLSKDQIAQIKIYLFKCKVQAQATETD